jgi:hypothetical protein
MIKSILQLIKRLESILHKLNKLEIAIQDNNVNLTNKH